MNQTKPAVRDALQDLCCALDEETEAERSEAATEALWSAILLHGLTDRRREIWIDLEHPRASATICLRGWRRRRGGAIEDLPVLDLQLTPSAAIAVAWWLITTIEPGTASVDDVRAASAWSEGGGRCPTAAEIRAAWRPPSAGELDPRIARDLLDRIAAWTAEESRLYPGDRDLARALVLARLEGWLSVPAGRSS